MMLLYRGPRSSKKALCKLYFSTVFQWLHSNTHAPAHTHFQKEMKQEGLANDPESGSSLFTVLSGGLATSTLTLSTLCHSYNINSFYRHPSWVILRLRWNMETGSAHRRSQMSPLLLYFLSRYGKIALVFRYPTLNWSRAVPTRYREARWVSHSLLLYSLVGDHCCLLQSQN